MLLDLARNDLSTGCEPGTVRVTSSFQPEVYSHVIHIVSEVTGTLMDDVSPLDLFARTFPAGTLTGAPKVRAMELIDEMEPSTRGFYGGCVGYFGYSGDMDTCITIRSVRFGPQETELRAGAGIVYDSNPETEFEEVEGKLGALFSAFRMMGQMEVNHDTTGR
jgi:anthranilate synthase component I